MSIENNNVSSELLRFPRFESVSDSVSGYSFAKLSDGDLMLSVAKPNVQKVIESWDFALGNFTDPDVRFLQLMIDQTGWEDDGKLFFVDPKWSQHWQGPGMDLIAVSDTDLNPEKRSKDIKTQEEADAALKSFTQAKIWAFVTNGHSRLAGELIQSRFVVLNRIM